MPTTVTKAELIKHLAQQYDIPAERAKAMVAAFFDGLAAALMEGTHIEIRGFGA